MSQLVFAQFVVSTAVVLEYVAKFGPASRAEYELDDIPDTMVLDNKCNLGMKFALGMYEGTQITGFCPNPMDGDSVIAVPEEEIEAVLGRTMRSRTIAQRFPGSRDNWQVTVQTATSGVTHEFWSKHTNHWIELQDRFEWKNFSPELAKLCAWFIDWNGDLPFIDQYDTCDDLIREEDRVGDRRKLAWPKWCKCEIPEPPEDR